MRVNCQTNSTVQFSVLSPGQVERIYTASLEVMERTGIRVESEEARFLLAEHGADLEGDTVSLPPHLVKQALAATPPRFTIYARDGTPALEVESGRVYFGPGPTCPNFLDPDTGQRRLYVRRDATAVARVCDALPHIDFVESLGVISDVDPHMADLYEFADMIAATGKPIVAWSYGLDSCRDIHHIAEAVAGGREGFRRRPNYIFYAEPSSPLTSTAQAVEKLLYCADQHIPIVYTPCPIGGATAPATLAGILVNAVAESLHGLVIAQLKRPGAPFVMGGVVSIMDMAQTILSYGAPELALLSAALAEIARYLGLPMWGTAGCTDAMTLDQQAALEAAISISVAALSGQTLVHDVGFIESGMTGSLEQLVMGNEIISMVKRLIAGVEVTQETLALDAIHNVGPGGHFLELDHTFAHYREFWGSPLIDRKRFADWQDAGSQSMGERVKAHVQGILAHHHPSPLPVGVQRSIESILRQATERTA
jgi:trimethylamine--corrinoid protein Co-methyltransferase